MLRRGTEVELEVGMIVAYHLGGLLGFMLDWRAEVVDPPKHSQRSTKTRA